MIVSNSSITESWSRKAQDCWKRFVAWREDIGDDRLVCPLTPRITRSITDEIGMYLSYTRHVPMWGMSTSPLNLQGLMIDIKSQRRWTFINPPSLSRYSQFICFGCQHGFHSIVYDFDNNSNSFHCVVRMYPPPIQHQPLTVSGSRVYYFNHSYSYSYPSS
jgi:hypothetical protein